MEDCIIKPAWPRFLFSKIVKATTTQNMSTWAAVVV